MSRHRRRDASYPEATKSDHMCHPSMKVSTGAGRGHPPAWLSSLRYGRAFALASEPMKVFIGSLVSVHHSPTMALTLSNKFSPLNR